MRRIFLLIPVMLLLCWSSDAYGQWREKWLAIGDYTQLYSAADGRVQDGEGSLWPFIRGAGDHHHSQTLWIAVKNFTDEAGREWPAKVAHSGPRVSGVGEVFPTEFRMVSRFQDPVVTVDGLPTFQVPTRIDEVDPTLKADRVIYNSLNSVTGITMEREIRAFSQQYHDDYHIWEYTFTNTGNVDDDEEIELPDQTLEGTYFIFMKRWRGPDAANDVIGGGASFGFNFMEGEVGAAGPDNYETDLRAQFVWQGNVPNFTRWDPLGAPAIAISGGGGPELPPRDTTGRLVLDEFMGRAYIHADKSATNTTDDPSQPSAMKWYWADNWLSSGQDHLNADLNLREYEYFAQGDRLPYHADVVEPHGDFAHPTGKPALDSPGGFKDGAAFGPYTLEPGQSVHLVIVEGIAGLEQEEATIAIGKAYKRLWEAGNQYGDIAYDADGDGQIESDEVMDKNEWVMTSRDSLFKVFRRARANYESGYDIPKPPLPPSEFHVTSGVGEITLEWEVFEGADPEGFEIYRTRNRFQGAVEDGYNYKLVHEAEPDERSFTDTDVVRGIDYYYYIQAVGEVNQDPTGLTPTGVRLKSSRYYTQTYNPARLKRAPGETLADTRVVPNPYNLASDENVRWPDRQDKIGFLNIPGQATIKIYTERGHLVETIEHTDGSGDAYWNLTTSANQVVVSGLYIALIQDNNTGEKTIRKFVIIR